MRRLRPGRWFQRTNCIGDGAFHAERVVITGGSQGIGYALAEALSGRCQQLTLLARDPDRLARAADALDCDTCATDVHDLTPQATARLADCTLVICCAGEMTPGRASTLTVPDYQRQMDTNFVGTVACVQAALPTMRARRAGTIVLLSSAAAAVGIYGYTAYGPTKSAVANYAAALRAELHDTGIRVVVAYPADTATPGFARECALRPAETAAIAGLISPQSAAAVAEKLLAALQTRAGTVTFDPGTAVLIAATTVCDRIVARYSHWLIHRARRRASPQRA